MNNFHKKFSTSILKKKDFYHIKINNNFLKTPHGNTFFVPSKNIAKVVLSELNLGTENSAVVSFTKRIEVIHSKICVPFISPRHFV